MEKSSRPRRSSAKAASEKMKKQQLSPHEKLVGDILSMGFNKKAIELAVYEQGYHDSESVVAFLIENPNGFVEAKKKSKKKHKKYQESAEAGTPSKTQQQNFSSSKTTFSVEEGAEFKDNEGVEVKNKVTNCTELIGTFIPTAETKAAKEHIEKSSPSSSRKKKKRKHLDSMHEEEDAEIEMDLPSSLSASSSKKKSKHLNENEKNLFKLLKKFRAKKENNDKITCADEARMFFILSSTVKAFLK